jgi:hypothetical protein
MMCDCDDDELAFVDATGGDGRVAEIGSDGATSNSGDVDAISNEGFYVYLMWEQRSGKEQEQIGVGWGEPVAETGRAPWATEQPQ